MFWLDTNPSLTYIAKITPRPMSSWIILLDIGRTWTEGIDMDFVLALQAAVTQNPKDPGVPTQSIWSVCCMDPPGSCSNKT